MLIVVGIISALTAVVFISLNPLKRFKDDRNHRRLLDSESVITAVHQFISDTGGSLPSGIDTTPVQLGNCLAGGNILCPGAKPVCLNISHTLANTKYLKDNPIDPGIGTAVTTGYTISRDDKNVYTVTACGSEGRVVKFSK